MSSLFGKLRKEAKKGKTSPQDTLTIDGQLIAEPIKEEDALSAEELTSLLNALGPVVETESAPQATETKPNSKVEAVKTKALFKAYGVYFDQKRKKFVQISIDYDPVSMYSLISKNEDIGDSQSVALFKITQLLTNKISKSENVL